MQWGHLYSGVCGIQCRQCSPLFWHLQNSVPERASYGTEYTCRAKKGFLRYATRFLKPSCAQNRLLGYGRDIRYQKGHPTVRDASSKARNSRLRYASPPFNLSSKTIPQCASASEIWSKLLKIFVRDQVYHTHQQLSLITAVGYSHSMVAGGLDEMSYTTLLMPRTLRIISLETSARKSYGRCTQSAVIPSTEVTARRATVFS